MIVIKLRRAISTQCIQNKTVPGTQYELYTHLLIETSAICPLDALCPLFSQAAQHTRRMLHHPVLFKCTDMSSLSLSTQFLPLRCPLWCLVHGRLYQYLMSKQTDHGTKGTETDILRSNDLSITLRDEREAAFLHKE